LGQRRIMDGGCIVRHLAERNVCMRGSTAPGIEGIIAFSIIRNGSNGSLSVRTNFISA
jgi:hypothetical protein